ncbi:MAG: hypothetical protein B6D56_04775 [Candidatus Omnitrophica bacterium 4484_70.1]|nr:MAG: hypothetical protein B6D56_04775 [Candidatus Omnitrophica bacterium 4484_70.1]
MRKRKIFLILVGAILGGIIFFFSGQIFNLFYKQGGYLLKFNEVRSLVLKVVATIGEFKDKEQMLRKELSQQKEKVRLLEEKNSCLTMKATEERLVREELRLGMLRSILNPQENKVKQWEQEIERLREEIKRFTLEGDNLRNEQERYKEKVSLLSQQKKELEAHLIQKDREIRSFKEREKLAQRKYFKEKKKMKEKIARLVTQNKQASKQLEEYKRKVSNLIKEREKLKQEVENLNSKVAFFYKDKYKNQEAISLLKKENLFHQKRIEELEKELIKLKEEYAKISQQYEIAIKGIDKDRLKLSRLTDTIGKFQSKLKEKEVVLFQLNGKLAQQVKELACLREKVVKLQIEKSKLAEMLKERDTQLHQLKEIFREITQTNTILKGQLQRLRNFFSLPLSEEKEVEVKIESVSPQGK